MLDKKILGSKIKEARQWTGLNQEEYRKKLEFQNKHYLVLSAECIGLELIY